MLVGLWLWVAFVASVDSGPLKEAQVDKTSAPLLSLAQPRTRAYTIDDGLPSNAVEFVAFDPTGHLWAGTQNGVAVYDGRSWRRLSIDSGSVGFVSTMLFGKDGSLLVGTVGNGLLARQGDMLIKQSLPCSEVRALWRGSSLFAGCSTGLYQLVNDTWQPVQALAGAEVSALAEVGGDLWVGTSKGIRVWGQNGAVMVTTDLPDPRVTAILPDGDTLWVGTEAGLARRTASGWAKFTVQQGLPHDQVTSLASAGGGAIWIGTYGGGVARWRDAQRGFESFNPRSGVPIEFVRHVAIDASRPQHPVLWVGTEAGLLRLIEDGWRAFPTASALVNTRLGAVLNTNEGELWLGGDGGLERHSKNQMRRYTFAGSAGTDSIFSLAEGHWHGKSGAFAGTRQGLLLFIDNQSSKRVAYRNFAQNNSLLSLLVRDDDLWIGRRDGLLHLHQGSEDDMSSLLPSGGQSVYMLLREGDAADAPVWVASGAGLLRIVGGKAKVWTTATGLPNNLVTRLLLDGRILWVGTGGGGVVRFDLESERMTAFGPQTDPRIENGFVNGLAFDAQHRLYSCTDRGVMRLTFAADGTLAAVRSFTVEDGLPSNEMWISTTVVDDNGRIWSGTAAGLAVLDPTQAVDDHVAPPLILERVVVAGATLSLDRLTALDAQQNDPTFEFALLSFKRESETRYRTQLEGLERQPTDWSSDNKRSYAALPHGSYTFKVWGRDYAGNEAGPVAVSVTISPSLWVRWWAIAIYIMVGAGVLQQGVRLRLRQLQQRAKALEEEVKKRTAQVEEKNRELSRANLDLSSKNEELVESNRRADHIFNQLAAALEGKNLDDKYQLEEKIGTGGFGVVFKAHELIDGKRGRDVAVKVFRPVEGNDTAEALERFRQEAVSAAKVNHPNAVQILGSGVSTDGIAYMVMELLVGETLTEEMTRQKRLPFSRCIEVLAPVCDVLAFAHQQGIVHRDIKPDNVFLQHEPGGAEHVKLLDFGVAKLQEPRKSIAMQSLTMTGAVVGTPTYMAPERLDGSSYDGRSDVYAIGIMMYEMLCGRPPFISEQQNIFSVITAHLSRPPPEIRSLDVTVPPAVEMLVVRTLSKKPSDRPTAAELAELLRKLS